MSWVARVALIAALLAAHSAVAQTSTAERAAERSIDEVLAQYVEEALTSNLTLRRQDLSVEISLAALDEARGRYLPQATLQSRYSRAEGGRAIVLPIGDLINPVYQTLNELLAAQGQPPAFTAIDNPQFSFLREREQETSVRVIQPLYAPELRAGVRASRAMLKSEEATRDTVARTLIRDVRTAYHNWLRTRQEVSIVDASAELLRENLRVNDSLFNNGKITRDQVLRAKAELLDVEQQRLSAANALDTARGYFNFLLNRPLATEIEVARVTDATPPPMDLSQLQTQAQQTRSELRQLEYAGQAAEAQISAATSRFKPTIALALESGIQGEDYRFGSEDDYSLASLNFTWNLFNGNQDRARLSQARLASRSVGLQRESATQQIALEVEQTLGDVRAAARALETASARRDAAREAFNIAARKRDAGVISQVEFLDARTTLTSAELNYSVTQFELLTRRAELDFALGTQPTGARRTP